MVKLLVSIIVVISTTLLSGQNLIIDQYVNTALNENLALKQKDFSYQQSKAALDEARSLFFPSVDIKARYTRAGGGRTIDIPIGDLMNPVHLTLNQLTGQQAFPGNLDNVNTPLLREEEHETKVSLVQPLFNLKLYHNYNMRSDLQELELAEKHRYARELIAEVKTAYYNISKASSAVKIYNDALELTKENLRVSESLVKNSKATKEVVLNAEAEVASIEQEIEAANKQLLIAKQYFNFLLNKELNEEVVMPSEKEAAREMSVPEDFGNNALKNREELAKLNFAKEASDKQVSLQKSDYFPNLNLAVEYGFQGEEYKFTSDDDYWMASLVFSWNIFKGFGDNARVEQARFNSKAYSAKLTETKKLISIEINEIASDLSVASKATTTSYKRKLAFKEAYEITQKKYNEGLTNQINLLKARTDFTNAQLQYAMAVNDYRIAEARLEKAACLINIDEKLESVKN